MTTVTTSEQIVMSNDTPDLLESTELDYIDSWCICGDRSRILGKGGHLYKDAGFICLILSTFS